MSPLQLGAVLLLVGISVTVLTAPPTAQSHPAPAAGRDQVVIGVGTEADFLNPLFTVAPAALITNAVLSTIFTADVPLNSAWRPVAQGVEYLPNLSDGSWRVDGGRMRLTWRIKRRFWHDGRPVTCGDYVFTHTLVRNEEVPVHDRPDPLIASVECPHGAGGTTVVVNWAKTHPYANHQVIPFGPLPRHVLAGAYQRSPSRLPEAPFGNLAAATIGDGPYRLVEWRKGRSITVEAVPDHPILGTPKIRRIVWRFNPDFNALVSELLAGTVDVLPQSAFGPRVDMAIELERRAAGRVKVFYEAGLSWEHIDINIDNPLLQNVLVRRALAYGINRTQIVQQRFAGRLPVSHTYLPRRHAGFTDAVTKYPYDPAKARALLAQAGFVPGSDGIVRSATGQRLSLELNTTAESAIRVQVAQLIQQQLRQIGVEIVVVNFPARVLFDQLLQRRQFKALAYYSWVVRPTFDCDELFTSDDIPAESNRWEGKNYPGYRNPEMDEACRGAATELDEGRRNAWFRRSAAVFSRELPALPLYYGARAAAAKSGLENFSFGASCSDCTVDHTWNAHTWHWR